jgi:hypothetical protein
MMKISDAIRMAHMFAEVAADASGVACMVTMGPCADGVRWEVMAAETGARIAVGVVAVSIDATAEAPQEAPRTRGKRAAAGRN